MDKLPLEKLMANMKHEVVANIQRRVPIHSYDDFILAAVREDVNWNHPMPTKNPRVNVERQCLFRIVIYWGGPVPAMLFFKYTIDPLKAQEICTKAMPQVIPKPVYASACSTSVDIHGTTLK